MFGFPPTKVKLFKVEFESVEFQVLDAIEIPTKAVSTKRLVDFGTSNTTKFFVFQYQEADTMFYNQCMLAIGNILKVNKVNFI